MANVALEDRKRLVEAGNREVGRRGEHDSPSTVTPAGDRIAEVVGISDGSRGWFDWTWSPRGVDTAARGATVDPGATERALGERRERRGVIGPVCATSGASQRETRARPSSVAPIAREWPRRGVTA